MAAEPAGEARCAAGRIAGDRQVRAGLSGSESIRGVRIEPGPTSTNTRAPSRCIASIISANRTGLAR